jgi:branched-chain amino acid transport system permease protein
MRRQFGWAVGVLLLIAIIFIAGPSFLTRDLITALFFTFIFITLAANYEILGGFLGYLNLGQAAFFGLGGYTTFIMIVKVSAVQALGPFVRIAAVLAALCFTLLFAWLASYPLFRLRGAYFSIATFGLVMLLSQLVINLTPITGGAYGLYISKELYLSLGLAYYLGFILMVSSLVLNAILNQSKMGLALKAIRESELAAAATGIPIFKYKLKAFLLSSIPSSLAGSLFVLYSGYIEADTVLGNDKTLFPVIIAMLGGSGHVFGPLVGAVIFRAIDVALKNYLLLPIPALGIYGLILMALGLFMPRGILNISKLRHSTRREKSLKVSAGSL